MALVVPIFVHKRYVLFHFINGFFFALIVCDLFYFNDFALLDRLFWVVLSFNLLTNKLMTFGAFMSPSSLIIVLFASCSKVIPASWRRWSSSKRFTVSSRLGSAVSIFLSLSSAFDDFILFCCFIVFGVGKMVQITTFLRSLGLCAQRREKGS